jgi:hypothetical protein
MIGGGAGTFYNLGSTCLFGEERIKRGGDTGGFKISGVAFGPHSSGGIGMKDGLGIETFC